MKSSNKSVKLPQHKKKNIYIYLAIFFCITNIVTILIFFNISSHRVDRFISRFPLIDPSRHLISQSDYIVNIQPLRERVRELAAEFGNDSVSIYIESLNTGANIAINQNNYILPASLTKVPLALAVIKKIENGAWDFNSELVLMPGDANAFSGDKDNPLSEFPIGTRFTVDTLLQELLINSDNTAYYIFLRNLHQDDLRLVIEAIGLEQLFSQEGKISAKEYSRLLRALYTASFLNRDNSQYVLSALDKATFVEFLRSGVPDDVHFPHKYGENDTARVYSDSGIVYVPNRPFIISVMVQANPEQSYESEQARAASFMQTVARESYEFFSTAQN